MRTSEFKEYGTFVQLLILTNRESIDVDDIFAFFNDGVVQGAFLTSARKMRAWAQEGTPTRLQRYMKVKMLPKRHRVGK